MVQGSLTDAKKTLPKNKTSGRWRLPLEPEILRGDVGGHIGAGQYARNGEHPRRSIDVDLAAGNRVRLPTAQSGIYSVSIGRQEKERIKNVNVL